MAQVGEKERRERWEKKRGVKPVGEVQQRYSRVTLPTTGETKQRQIRQTGGTTIPRSEGEPDIATVRKT